MNNDSFEKFSQFVVGMSGEGREPASHSHHGLLSEDNLQIGGPSLVQGSSREPAAENLPSPVSSAEASAAIASPPLRSQANEVATLARPPENKRPVENSQEPLTRRWLRSSDVNKVTWAQVGNVAEPGRYRQQFGWLLITAEDLAVWRKFPTASFALCEVSNPQTTEGEFRLGSFDPHSEGV